MLYEVAMVLQAKKKSKKDEVLLAPTCVIAEDEQQAYLAVVLENAEYLAEFDRDRIQVFVRPFI